MHQIVRNGTYSIGGFEIPFSGFEPTPIVTDGMKI